MVNLAWWQPFKKEKDGFTYVYYPIKEMEVDTICPLRVEFYDSENGQHSWLLMLFENPRYKLQGISTINGEIRSFDGVSAGQAKVGTYQMLEFTEPVQFAPPKPDRCQQATKVKNHYEIQVAKGECLYAVRNAKNERGYIVIAGYEGVKLKEGK